MLKIIVVCLLMTTQVNADEYFGKAVVLADNGQLQKAEEIISHQLSKSTTTQQDKLKYLALLGDVYFYKNNTIEAMKYYHNALDIAHDTKNSYQIAEQYKNIAISHSELSEFGESLRWHQKAWQQLERDNNTQGNTGLSVLLAQSSIYGYIGAFEQSMETISKAQNLASKINKLDALSDSYLRMASIQSEVKNYHASLNALQLVDTNVMNDRSSLAWYFSMYANTLIHLNQTKKSQEIINQALNYDIQWTESDINNFEILLLETYLHDGNLEQANPMLADLEQNMDNFDESWVMHFLLAKKYKLEKKHNRSFDTNIKAISLFFKHASFNQHSNNSLFFNIPQNLVEATIVDAMDVGLSQSDLIFELFYLAFLAKEPIHVKPGESESTQSQTGLKAESAVINDILFGEASLNFSDRLKLSELQDGLNQHEGFVFYLSIGDNFYSMLVTNTTISSFQLLQNTETIQNLVIKLLTQLESNNQDWSQTAHQLDDLLIQPLRQQGLEKLNSLHFVQDSNLRFLPMDLLLDEQGVLLSDRHDIAINTVKSLKKYLNTQHHSQSIEDPVKLNLIGVSEGKIELPSFWHTAYRNLNLAQNNLPSVNKELLELNQNISNSFLTLGHKATETRTKHIINEARGILHFASHGFDNPIAPAYSALVLKPDDSNDGLLQAREISKLKTQAQLVVLASCSSAKGGLSGLYGYSSGLAESFIHAGAKTVIGTLWDVKDKKTYQLMQWFYQGLSHNLTVSKALNHAKKQARLSGWNVYDWSAFILLGQTDLKLQLSSNKSNNWIYFVLITIIILMVILYSIKYRVSIEA